MGKKLIIHGDSTNKVKIPLRDNFNPALHPRDDEGKFTERIGISVEDIAESVTPRSEFSDSGFESAWENAFFDDEKVSAAQEYLQENTSLEKVKIEQPDRITENFPEAVGQISLEVLRLDDSGQLENVDELHIDDSIGATQCTFTNPDPMKIERTQWSLIA